MREIYEEIVNIISRGERAVLATVISVEGSAPRGSGAKMLIKQDGTSVGSVGGGGSEMRGSSAGASGGAVGGAASPGCHHTYRRQRS